MKRDFNLLRKLLLNIADEAKPKNEIELHLHLLREGGFIELTEEGKKFISLSQNESNWEQAISKLKEADIGLSYQLLKDILNSAKSEPILSDRFQ